MIYTVARELPGTLSTMAAPQGDLDGVLLALREQGVDTLVSLLPPEQTTMLFLTDEPDAAYRAGLAFRSLPVPDFGVPDHAEFARPLRELSDELSAGRHVAVHCWGGVGRSSHGRGRAAGASAAAPPEAAWHRVAYARGVPVPETDEQRDWVGAGWPPQSRGSSAAQRREVLLAELGRARRRRPLALLRAAQLDPADLAGDRLRQLGELDPADPLVRRELLARSSARIDARGLRRPARARRPASTYALGTASRSGSGDGTTAASATASCSISTLSSSNGLIR